MQRSRFIALASIWLSVNACANHFVFHPKVDPPGVQTRRETVVRGKLLIRLEWARPAGEGPFAAVIVHPEAGHVAGEMRGVVRDLAKAGYLAVAADYRREKKGIYRQTLFTWQDPDDPRAVIDLVRRRPDVDPERIALVGFSQGGVYSLLIAAYTQQAAAVVAYYPVTDFAAWLEEAGGASRGRRLVFRLIRRHFMKQSEARDQAELQERLARASALRQAEAIRAPVLLIHGDRDRSAGLNESVRLFERLKELHREAELVVVPDAGHVFNFRNRQKARVAWEATLSWLDRHLRPPTDRGARAGLTFSSLTQGRRAQCAATASASSVFFFFFPAIFE